MLKLNFNGAFNLVSHTAKIGLDVVTYTSFGWYGS
jgi:hypothetical protein